MRRRICQACCCPCRRRVRTKRLTGLFSPSVARDKKVSPLVSWRSHELVRRGITLRKELHFQTSLQEDRLCACWLLRFMNDDRESHSSALISSHLTGSDYPVRKGTYSARLFVFGRCCDCQLVACLRN